MPEEQSYSTIGLRVVCVLKSRRRQIATEARIIRLHLSVVSPANQWVTDGVKQTGSCRSFALVEITRILVEKRWQDRSADHDVGETIGCYGAKPLAIALRALLVVRGVTRLIEAGDEACTENSAGSTATLSASLNLSFAVIGAGSGS